jgi:3-dehydrosphinganine reductase
VGIESLDVSDEDATLKSMQRIAEAHGGIDVLINSAGILREGRFEALPMRLFRDVMDINYFGIIHATRAALPHLRASRGRLLNIASMAGLTGVFGYTPYCGAKHALVGLTESLRYELKPTGVRVHLVCPGEFDSPMVDALDRSRTPENRAHALTIPKATVTKIAAQTLSGIRANRFLIVPGALTRAVAFGIRHFPRVTRAVGDRAVAKAQRQL